MHACASAPADAAHVWLRRARADIRRDPAFRAQFHAMCASAGVDPLASNKGAWAELLGFGDFYYELAVQIVEACRASRPHNGGLMALRDLKAAVTRRRGAAAQPVSTDDLLRAIAQLRALGGGWDLLTVGDAVCVRSVPAELNGDQTALLARAAAAWGVLTAADVVRDAGWSQRRVSDALEGLLMEGLAMVDDGHPDGVRRYWVTAFAAAPTAAPPSQQAAATGAAAPPAG